jgi:hypothetical protein
MTLAAFRSRAIDLCNGSGEVENTADLDAASGSARAGSTSDTTSIQLCTDPGSAVVTPLPKMIDASDPGCEASAQRSGHRPRGHHPHTTTRHEDNRDHLPNHFAGKSYPLIGSAVETVIGHGCRSSSSHS